MKKKNKVIIISALLLCLFSVSFIVSYAFFNYSEDTNAIVINTGNINMYLTSSTEVNLTNMFPETMQEARKRTDNYIDFTVSSDNEYKNPIYYEIKLSYGNDVESKTRILDKYLKYELYDMDYTDPDILVFNGNSDSIDNKTIYIDKFDTNSSTVTRSYRLRVWISDDVIVGNTASCVYTAEEWDDLFASIKVTVVGDLEEKDIENINVMGTLSAFSSYGSVIKEINFINEEQSIIDSDYENATVKFDVTNADHTVGTSKLQAMTDYGKVLAWLEPIDETYYTLNVASDGYTYLSTGANLFNGYNFKFSNLTTIDLSNAKTNFVTDMLSMFYACTGLTNLDISNLDTSNVTCMTGMFTSCSSLTTLNFNNFDTSKVTNMCGMFSGCSNFTTLNLSNFDTDNVTGMSGMFSGSTNLTSLDVSNFDTSKVTDMSSMFDGCSNLTSLDVSKFDTSNVTNMYAMFRLCYSLTNLDLSSFNTSNVTNMSSMFSGCFALTTLNLSNFDTSNVTNMSSMFNYCKVLTTIKVGTNWSTTAVTISTDMFNNCTNLVGGSGTIYDSSHVDATYAVIDTAVYDTDGTTVLSGTPGYLTADI